MSPFPLFITQLDDKGHFVVEWKVMFEPTSGGIRSVDTVTIAITRTMTTGAIQYRRPQDSVPFLTSRSHTPLHVFAGDVINYHAGQLRIDMDGLDLAVLLSAPRAKNVTLEDFMQDNPDATPREVWDAAFMAGHQTAHIMLTGDPS